VALEPRLTADEECGRLLTCKNTQDERC